LASLSDAHHRQYRSSALGRGEALVEVGEDVVDGLEPDRQPDEAGGDAGRELLLTIGALARTPVNFAQSAAGLLAEPPVFEEVSAIARRTQALVSLLPSLGTHLAVSARPALPFHFAYDACARRGRFRNPADHGAVLPATVATLDGSALDVSAFSANDNDGIVNTLSMLWPYEPSAPERHTISFIKADHADVIGHYELRPEDQNTRHLAYDLLDSGKLFQKSEFNALWSEIFAFAFEA